MKKFLSSLLALTMILSLVIVPANAADSLTISGEDSVNIGHKITLTAPSLTEVTVSSQKYDVASIKYTWSSSDTTKAGVKTTEQTTSNTTEVTGKATGDVTINCAMEVTYNVPAGPGGGSRSHYR